MAVYPLHREIEAALIAAFRHEVEVPVGGAVGRASPSPIKLNVSFVSNLAADLRPGSSSK
jgi:hypothetical protein